MTYGTDLDPQEVLAMRDTLQKPNDQTSLVGNSWSSSDRQERSKCPLTALSRSTGATTKDLYVVKAYRRHYKRPLRRQGVQAPLQKTSTSSRRTGATTKDLYVVKAYRRHYKRPLRRQGVQAPLQKTSTVFGFRLHAI
ncbi:uncharacterized protein [Littorina saxatilis]|uniref:uncharacterized protein n=1 Tax=Littorina saxatilis TaxID=31220 RepID=UPI0038B5CC3E